jgi:SAM-dependent MidA family methyltransferase
VPEGNARPGGFAPGPDNDPGCERPLRWYEAMHEALYGERGFYRQAEGPARHFRTSVHASPLFATALLHLLAEVDAALGHPRTLTVVDVGAGRGELLISLAQLVRGEAAEQARAGRQLSDRLQLVGVEVNDRPVTLPAGIGWSAAIPTGVSGLLLANEWLDNAPIDIAERTGDGARAVLVDPTTGAEYLGPALDAPAAAWLERWWPLTEPGTRAEIGYGRDAAWAQAVAALRTGLALAVDYAHSRANRPPFGTIAGYRYGRWVPPVPDSSCDLTAHVALDACAEAGRAAGATDTVLTTQRQALHALGVRAARPPVQLAHERPQAYLRALQAAGEAAELTAREGLGDFAWLAQTTGGCPMPGSLRTLPRAGG